jgi:hypothetical protein
MKTASLLKTIPASKPSPAREALAAFKRGELAAAQRAERDAVAAMESARAVIHERERTLADARQRAQAAAAANDREGFRTARFDVEFDEQQLAIATQAVTDAEQKHRAATERLSGLEQRRGELVIAVLMEEARGHETELHRLEAECVQHFARLDATLNHFRQANVTGKPVEELAGIFERLRAFAIIRDEHRETSRAELRELLNNLTGAAV